MPVVELEQGLQPEVPEEAWALCASNGCFYSSSRKRIAADAPIPEYVKRARISQNPSNMERFSYPPPFTVINSPDKYMTYSKGLEKDSESKPM